jgi:hypothetical protein
MQPSVESLPIIELARAECDCEFCPILYDISITLGSRAVGDENWMPIVITCGAYPNMSRSSRRSRIRYRANVEYWPWWARPQGIPAQFQPWSLGLRATETCPWYWADVQRSPVLAPTLRNWKNVDAIPAITKIVAWRTVGAGIAPVSVWHAKYARLIWRFQRAKFSTIN